MKINASDLYKQLEKDFISPNMHDNFANYMPTIYPYMTKNFIERSMGLVCDFTDEINQVYTAVFPSDNVMSSILADKPNGAMLFLHHPSIWSFQNNELGFTQIDTKWIELFQASKIAIYALHVPLDNYGIHATSKTLAEAIGLDVTEPFAEYGGGLCGVIGKTRCKTANELNEVFASAVGHRAKLYPYGDKVIRDGLVAVVAGGGNDIAMVQSAVAKSVNTYVTGITVLNDYSADRHKFNKDNRVNIMGGTHYSTEKFACQSMCVYFRKLGLPARFIKDVPTFEDL